MGGFRLTLISVRRDPPWFLFSPIFHALRRTRAMGPATMLFSTGPFPLTGRASREHKRATYGKPRRERELSRQTAHEEQLRLPWPSLGLAALVSAHPYSRVPKPR